MPRDRTETQTIMKNKQDHRASSAESYYTPIEGKRDNVVLLLGQQGTKILTNSSSEGIKADGVEFGTQGGQRYNVYAGKEVIVSTGAIQTPALLQLSGIGDSAVLQAAGVEVVLNLPGVGKNFQEQTKNVVAWNWVDGYNPDGTGPSSMAGYPDINAVSLTTDRR